MRRLGGVGRSGALAAQLGFPSLTALLTSPGDQPALVIVDNCEHVLDAAAEAVAALLDSCASPSVVATSRSPLDLPGESLVVLGPLPLPRDADARRPPPPPSSCSSSGPRMRAPRCPTRAFRRW